MTHVRTNGYSFVHDESSKINKLPETPTVLSSAILSRLFLDRHPLVTTSVRMDARTTNDLQTDVVSLS